jgi:hypothetical protein
VSDPAVLTTGSRWRVGTKIFCIGFHKTGTTSMGLALGKLGYRVTGSLGTRDPRIADHVYALVDAMVPRFDAFQDNPWPVLYRYLDEKHPGSRFILTVRSPESWIRSQVRDFARKETPMRQWIYGAGCPAGNEEIYLARYRRHNEEVLAYFANRPKDFLRMDLPAGDGWDKLCAFLGRPVPAEPFPRANPASRSRAIKNSVTKWLTERRG